jgi:hypothetical protein
MALTTSLAGRVRNTSLPKSHALLPLLEAIVNGIQAIDARTGGSDQPGRIDVRFGRRICRRAATDGLRMTIVPT